MRLMDVLQGVQPSLGCTEPAAIALATALAREAIEGEVKKVTVLCDANVFKNALHVNIPGLEGVKGTLMAAGLGVLAGDPQLRLEIFSEVSSEDVRAVRGLAGRGLINVSTEERERPGLYIEALVETDLGSGRAIIEDMHTNVTAVEASGQPLPSPDWVGAGDKGGAKGGEAVLKEMTLETIVKLAENMTAEEMAYMLEGVKMNEAASREGLARKVGLRIGACLAELVEEGLLADDPASRAEMFSAAAVDARMSGMMVPVMTSGYSGNQGIVATIPIATVARGLEANEEELAEAIAISHLVTAYVKEHVGNLSALCGACVAGVIGAAAGIVRLLGGGTAEIEQVINIMAGNIAGVICDGAKLGCALKVGTAASVAVKSAMLVMRGVQMPEGEGIVGETAEATVCNLGALANPGMVQTDAQILQIILKAAPDSIL
jgi:L-cysteine desulfidase